MNKPPLKPGRQQKMAAKLKENLRRRKGQSKTRALAKDQVNDLLDNPDLKVTPPEDKP